MNFKKEELIKSPLNYTGGKFKLLPQLLPLFPNNINTFVDLFCGGCNVGVNVDANQIYCNDIESHVIELLQYWKQKNYDYIIEQTENIIHKYNLSESNKNGYEYYNSNSNDGLGKYNKDNYIKLRYDYNINKTPDMFYTVIIYAFNNMLRFNDKNEFNVAVNKRDFNNNLRKILKAFIDRLNTIHINFTNNNFNNLKIDKLHKNDFVYADPPYLITLANYNERDGWNETHEKELLDLLDSINKNNIKFALSNVLENKGKSNDILKEWSKKYNIHYLNNTYGNCNYHTKDKSKNSTVEVLITNY